MVNAQSSVLDCDGKKKSIASKDQVDKDVKRIHESIPTLAKLRTMVDEETFHPKKEKKTEKRKDQKDDDGSEADGKSIKRQKGNKNKTMESRIAALEGRLRNAQAGTTTHSKSSGNPEGRDANYEAGMEFLKAQLSNSHGRRREAIEALLGHPLFSEKRLPKDNRVHGNKDPGTDRECRICAVTEWGQRYNERKRCKNCETHVTATCHVTVGEKLFGKTQVEGLGAPLCFGLINKLYPRRKWYGANEDRNRQAQELYEQTRQPFVPTGH
jgi:hypothetical protein